jgi:hypothetical protein
VQGEAREIGGDARVDCVSIGVCGVTLSDPKDKIKKFTIPLRGRGYYYYYLFILHRAESYGNGYLLSKAHNLLPRFYLLGFCHIFGLLALSRP